MSDVGDGALPTGPLTFLFTDVVDSTAMWERAPDVMDATLARHDEIVEGAVERHGGIVLKHKGEGDSTFCVFEQPAAAVAAATDAQRELTSESWEPRAPIVVRMGIHHGEAILRGRDYYGQTINRAARVRAVAIGGQVLLSSAAALAIGNEMSGRVELRFLRRELLKGIERAEEIFELVDHDRPVAAVAGATDVRVVAPLPKAITASLPSVFVGRVDVLGRLEEARKRAVHGAQMVLLGGEPGAGKSTIASIAGQAAHDAESTVLFGACDEHMQTPFGPFLGVFEHHVDSAPWEVLAEHVGSNGGEIGRLAPSLRLRMGELPLIEAIDPETTRRLLVEAAIDLLERSANVRPIVLVLDDLQWADANSVTLIDRILDSSAAVLVVGTYRSAPSDRLRDMLDRFGSRSNVEDIGVDGLDESELLDLIQGAAGHQVGQDGLDLATYLIEETAGNPFFVAELLRHFVETGVLMSDEVSGWRMGVDLTTVSTPHSVRAIVQQRIRRLGAGAERVLEASSVAGRAFESRLVAEVLDLSETDVLDALEAAVHSSIVREVGVGAFEFSHALVQHTLYEQLGSTRRALYHGGFAVAIEDFHGGDARPAVIARHWMHAPERDDDKLARLSRRAGAAAMAALSPEDAARWFEQALDLTSPDDDATRLELLIELGDAQRWADSDAFRQTLLDASSHAEAIGDRDSLVRAALANNRGGASLAGSIDEGRVAVLERAIEVVGSDDSPERARLLATLAIELSQGDEWQRVSALADDAAACARRLGDEVTLLQVLLLTTEATRVPPTLAQRLQDSAGLLDIAARTGDPILLGIAALREVRVKIESARFDEATDALEVLDEVAHLDPYVRMNSISVRAVLAQVRGDLDGALQLAAHARDAHRSEADGTAVYVATTSQILWDMGALGTMLSMIEQTVEKYPGVTGFRAVLGIAYCDVDRLDDAAAILQRELDSDFSDHSFNPLWLITMSILASLAVEVGDPVPAKRLYEILEPWRGRANSSVVSINGLVTESLAGLALVSGDIGRAEMDAAEALDQARQVGARVSELRIGLIRARIANQRDGTDDRRQAQMTARAVAAAAAEIGMDTLVRRARDFAESIDTKERL